MLAATGLRRGELAAMDSTEAWQRGTTPYPKSGAVAKRSYPTPEVRGGSLEEQLHVQGAAAVRAQESLEELFHVQGQEGWQ